MIETFNAAQAHKGTSFVEVFQNCVIFNNKTFDPVTGRDVKSDQVLYLEDSNPLFGQESNQGIRLNGLDPEIVAVNSEEDKSKLMIHNSKSPNVAYPTLLAQMTYPTFPTSFRSLRQLEGRETYEDSVVGQIKASQANGEGFFAGALTGKNLDRGISFLLLTKFNPINIFYNYGIYRRSSIWT